MGTMALSMRWQRCGFCDTAVWVADGRCPSCSHGLDEPAPVTAATGTLVRGRREREPWYIGIGVALVALVAVTGLLTAGSPEPPFLDVLSALAIWTLPFLLGYYVRSRWIWFTGLGLIVAGVVMLFPAASADNWDALVWMLGALFLGGLGVTVLVGALSARGVLAVARCRR